MRRTRPCGLPNPSEWNDSGERSPTQPGRIALRKLLVAALVLAVIGAGVFWVVTIPATVPASALGAHTPNAENGATMFHAGGCTSCHATPGQDDKTRLGGGLGLKSPFGTFYVPNISPDANDGIGKWSEADF